MKQHFLLVGVTLLIVLILTVPAGAKKKQTRSGTGGLNAAIIDCWKQHGAVYDPVRKKWVIEATSELNVTYVGDSIRRCISRRTGIPPSQIPVPEETMYP
jgi:hypothetical protein